MRADGDKGAHPAVGAGSTSKPDVPRRQRLVAWTIVAVLAIAIAVLSLMPKIPTTGLRHGDKFGHLFAYAVLGLALTHALGSGRTGAGAGALVMTAVLAVVGSSSWGGLLELLQGLVPNRSADLADAAANGVGAVLGAQLWLLPRLFLRARACLAERNR